MQTNTFIFMVYLWVDSTPGKHAGPNYIIQKVKLGLHVLQKRAEMRRYWSKIRTKEFNLQKQNEP
ncbi:hypothetical protein MuYL_4861 [Mucilaginibacter xinganensis]|uniref:Uncharacterized protein n=1 Tax=Mucilaginibacter xinganensis TaxID=1234841 RepID=A0A223P452_9SPHI|nr:hypothetical protein MuYL_4861 [Mucilaginibacter xinganensis]